MKKLMLLVVLLTALSACKKDVKTTDTDTTSPPLTPTNTLSIKFENYAGTTPLILNTVDYVNQHSDTFKVSLFNYYISNIQLTATDSFVYSETYSYHLIKASDFNSLEFSLPNVPLKNFKAISFMIGVDSLHNVSGAQSGALEPLNGMFWDWNSGYIMSKFEGTSPQSPLLGHTLLYHQGGFSGPDNVIKTVNLNFPNNATVTTAISPKVILKADLLEWFKTPNIVNFSTLTTIHMPGTDAKLIADNYADMFSVTQVQN